MLSRTLKRASGVRQKSNDKEKTERVDGRVIAPDTISRMSLAIPDLHQPWVLHMFRTSRCGLSRCTENVRQVEG